MNAYPSFSEWTARVLRSVSAIAAAALLLSTFGVASAAAQTTDQPAEVPNIVAQADDVEGAPLTFLQGVGDRSFDVYINGKIAMRSVAFATFSAQLVVPNGKHRIDLRDAGAKRRSKRLARISLTVSNDRPLTVASYERPNGKIKLYKKSVDASWVNGESRLIVRHLAKAPSVSMSYDGGPVFRDIRAGRSRRAVVPALPFEINITTASDNGSVSVLPPARVTLAANTVTVVYVVGDFDDGTARVVFHAYRTPLMQNG